MTDIAAAGLAYLFGDAELPFELDLHVIAETNSTVTLGWTPVPGCVGYRYSRAGYVKPDGSPRYSHTFDGSVSSVKFAKAAWYRVEALAVPAEGTYPRQTTSRRAQISYASLTIGRAG